MKLVAWLRSREVDLGWIKAETQSLPSRSLRDDSTRQKEEMIMELEHLDKIQEAVDGSTQESIEKLRITAIAGWTEAVRANRSAMWGWLTATVSLVLSGVLCVLLAL